MEHDLDDLDARCDGMTVAGATRYLRDHLDVGWIEARNLVARLQAHVRTRDAAPLAA